MWKKDLERATELIPGLLRRPIQGAFGEANDDPEASFGKMTVVAQAEPVGPGEKPEDRRGGYALELRKFPGLSTGNRTKLTATVRDLIANSRRVHGTDVPIAPNVVPQVVVPATLPPPATLLVVVTPAPTTDKY